jgi:hypothetical protein
MRFVPIENVFLAVQNEMGEDWQGEQPVYQAWVKDAIKKIASKVSFDRVIEVLNVNADKTTIDICDDTYGVQALLLGDKKNGLVDIFSKSCNHLKLPTYKSGDNEFGNGFLFIGHDVKPASFNVRWSVRDSQIELQNETKERQVTVLSKKFKRDKKGKLMVAETDVNASAYYILQLMARRTRWRQKEQRLSLQDIAAYDVLFTNNLMDARAEGAKASQTRLYERNIMLSFKNTGAHSKNQ